MPHALKNLFTGANIVGELLPMLNRIIAPELKPVGSFFCYCGYSCSYKLHKQVNSQLIKAEERGTLLKLVHQMLTLGLSFVQDKTEDGQLMYKLDPYVRLYVDRIQIGLTEPHHAGRLTSSFTSTAREQLILRPLATL